MKKSTAIVIILVSVVLACLLTFSATVLVLVRVLPAPTVTPAVTPGQSDDSYQKLREIQAYLDTYFIGEVDEKQMQDSLAEGMINGLGDRWSYYIPAEQYSAYQESMNNAYVGIGVTITADSDEGLLITDVTPDSPAYHAGIEIGDIIVLVDGESVLELGIEETKNRVRGEEGTDAHITVRHDGVDRDLTITRERIHVVNVTWEMLEGDLAYIKIRNFDANASKDSIAAIEEAMGQGAKGLIFDVRFNPGGLKNELVKLLDYLLPEGPLFRSEDYTGRESVDYSDASHIDLPMVVLVNKDSYSAAEFFAAALQEYEAAKVVGTQTFGKGYFQTSFQLSDGSAINISIGKYTTPKGVSLVGTGITPDQVVEISDEEYQSIYYSQMTHEDDVQLQAAIALLQ